ncbi:MAG: histidinol dehydrogenase, partial [Pseudomonadota bacterium]
MTRRLNINDSGFEADFARLLGDKREQAADVNDAVAGILSDVRTRGDAAVRDYTSRFDGFDLPAAGARLSADQIELEADKCPADVLAALKAAAARIQAYHQRQVPGSERY